MFACTLHSIAIYLFRSFALVVALVRVYTRNQSDFRFLLQLLAYVHIRSFSFYDAGQLFKL